MPLSILARRSLIYRETGSGEMTVLLVPGQDQIQVVKDLAGLGRTETVVATREAGAAKAQAVRKQVQLSRVMIGRRYIYGNLPNEISDLRQSVKVWLAEDYAPSQCQAFFYIFSSTVVIHGVREQDDEGQQNWRTAQLTLGEGDSIKAIIDAISDYALANSTETLTVAVQSKLDLYEKLQEGLATYNISPVPFTKLKPMPGLKPLYRHRDHTIMYLTFALFGLITVLASGSYMMLSMFQRNALDDEIRTIQQRIEAIKLNQNVGQIANPQELLQQMSRGINQQPSAILHATATVGGDLGALDNMKIFFSGQGDSTVMTEAPAAGQVMAYLNLFKMEESLLVGQEQRASDILAVQPWVRSIVRGGAPGDQAEIAMLLQIDQDPNTNALPQPMPAPFVESQPVGESETISGSELDAMPMDMQSPTVPELTPQEVSSPEVMDPSATSSFMALPSAPAPVQAVSPAASSSLPVISPTNVQENTQ